MPIERLAALHSGAAVSDRADVAAATWHNYTTAPNITMLMLVKPLVETTNRAFFSKANAGGSDRLRLRRDASTPGRVEYRLTRNTTDATAVTDAIMLHRWQWIAAMCDSGFTNILRIYRSFLGESQLREVSYVSQGNGSGTIQTADGRLIVGNVAGNDQAFEGLIGAALLISSGSPTVATLALLGEIIENVEAGQLVAWRRRMLADWRDFKQPGAITDLSGFGRNLSITGLVKSGTLKLPRKRIHTIAALPNDTTLAAAVTVAVTAAAPLATDITMAASATVALTTSAALETANVLAGTATVALSAAGALTTDITLAAAKTVAITTAATLRVPTSFFDDFLGTSLHARWAQLTGGSGSIAVADSKVTLSTPATGDSAAIHLNVTLDPTISQFVFVELGSQFGANAGPLLSLINKSTAPVVEDAATYAGRKLIEIVARTSPNKALDFRYWDSGGTQHNYDGPTEAWTTDTTDQAVQPVLEDDFYGLLIEFDADDGNARWRVLAVHKTAANGAGIVFATGLKVFQLTPWVNWSSTRSSSAGIWLVIGDPLNDSGADTIDVESVQYGDEGRIYSLQNMRATSGAYSIRSGWSYDGKLFVAEDRTAAEISNAKDQWGVFDGTTYHLWYKDETTTPRQIEHATAASPKGPYTFQDVVWVPASGFNATFPCVQYAPWEADPDRVWQMLLVEVEAATGEEAIRYLYSSSPNGPWTDGGIVLSKGTAGADDSKGCGGPFFHHRNGQYEVFYTAKKDGAVNNIFQAGMRATGPALDNLTKDGAGVRLPTQDQNEVLTASLDGRDVTLADTTGFAVRMPVILSQSTTASQWNMSRVRKLTGTGLELMHRVTGYGTSYPAKIFGLFNGNNGIRDIIRKPNGEWWVYLCPFNVNKLENATYNSGPELSGLLIVPAGTDLADMDPSMVSYPDCPSIHLGNWSDTQSNENIALIHTALEQTVNDMSLAAAVTISTSAAAALETAITMAAAANVGVTPSASLSTEITMAAAAAVQVSAAGALATDLTMAASAAVTVSAAGALATDIQLAATAELAISAAGALTTDIQLAAASTVAIQATGELAGATSFFATPQVTVSAAGALVTSILLAGSAAVTVTTGAVLATSIQFAAAISVAITTMGELSVGASLAATAEIDVFASASLATAPGRLFGPSRAHGVGMVASGLANIRMKTPGGFLP